MDDPWGILSGLETSGTMTGLACAAKAAGVLAVAGLAAFAMRRRAAATRHLVWGLGLAGALAVLPLTFALPRFGVSVLEAQAPVQTADAATAVPAAQPIEIPANIQAAGPAVGPPVALPEGAPVALSASGSPRSAWPLIIWAGGTLAVLAWGLIGSATIWWLGRNAQRITDPRWDDAVREALRRLGVSRRVMLLRGSPSAMPLTWGVLRPTPLLPEEADDWPEDRRRAVLLHELAHVRRRDVLTQWLGLTTCAAYWFNPLAWWAAARLRAEREQACDDLVLEAGEPPCDYAAQLLDVARSLRPVHTLAPPALAMARRSGLETRLRSILDAHRQRRAPGRWLVAGCLAAVLAASATLAAVQLVAKEPPRPVVSGQVVGPDGKPIDGANMVVVASRVRSRYRDSDKPTVESLGRGRSDDQGRFRIELAREPESDEGQVVLAAAARDRGFAARELTDLNGALEEPLRLPVEQPVEVRLIDLEGSPVAGAEVRPAGLYPDRVGTGLSSDILAEDFLPPLTRQWTSDRDGKFLVRGLGPAHNGFFDVRAPGFGRQRVRLTTKAGVGTAALTLGRAHVVEGRVTLGKDGPPAVGARIEARTMSEKHGIGMHLGQDEATTDEEGHYRIEAAPGAAIVLKAFPPRDAGDGYLLRGNLVNPGDSVASHVDFALPRGVLVRGRVIEAGTGRPVAGAVVYHEAHERNNPYFIKGNPSVFNADELRAVTDANGAFRLGIMPGPGYLLAKAPTRDYLHEEISNVDLHGQLIWPNTRNYPEAFRKLSPKPDEGPIDVELKLRRGVTVRGHLVDPEGQPVREALLASRWYLSMNGMTVNHAPTSKSLRDGHFAVDGCNPGSSATVVFLDAKNQRGAAVALSGKQAGDDVKVTMQPCGTAVVRFVDAQGKPVRAGRSPAHLELVLSPGASMGDIRNDDQKTSPLMADAIYVANLDRERYRGIKTDATGRMTFPTLVPGATYRLSVFNQKAKTELTFTVKPGEAKHLGDLKITNLEHAG